ncbi:MULTISPECIES: hypothetical protein [unclassified Nonomuraea]|uniref:hypothetical protein n=1 Tax=unclassified Nonomuraea TaxID=2593643 RepID=UPI0033C8885A
MRPFFTRRREPPPVGPRSNDAELLSAVAADQVEALKLLHYGWVAVLPLVLAALGWVSRDLR